MTLKIASLWRNLIVAVTCYNYIKISKAILNKQLVKRVFFYRRKANQ